MKFEQVQDRFLEIRSNKLFEFVVISVIIASAALVGATSFSLSDNTLLVLNILDWSITAFFLVEISIRFIAEPHKRDFFRSGWNIFDSLVVLFCLLPTGHHDTAMVARLVRVFRVLRMVSIVPEMRVLLTSLLKALPQLGYILAMMFIIFYLYGAIGNIFFHEINPDLWGNVAIAMLTLFRIMTFEDWTDVMYETMDVLPMSWTYYLSFIFLTAFAFLNMVIGVVVNVLEKESQRRLHEEENMPDLRDIQNEIRQLRQLLEK